MILRRFSTAPKLNALEIGLTEIYDFSSLGENQSIKDLTLAGYYEKCDRDSGKNGTVGMLFIYIWYSE